jgi:hypothetical protein
MVALAWSSIQLRPWWVRIFNSPVMLALFLNAYDSCAHRWGCVGIHRWALVYIVKAFGEGVTVLHGVWTLEPYHSNTTTLNTVDPAILIQLNTHSGHQCWLKSNQQPKLPLWDGIKLRIAPPRKQVCDGPVKATSTVSVSQNVYQVVKGVYEHRLHRESLKLSSLNT